MHVYQFESRTPHCTCMFRAVIKLWRKLQFNKESFMLLKTENNLDDLYFNLEIVGNPKFNAVIWELEQARTFLLLSGFEQVQMRYSINLHDSKILNICNEKCTTEDHCARK